LFTTPTLSSNNFWADNYSVIWLMKVTVFTFLYHFVTVRKGTCFVLLIMYQMIYITFTQTQDHSNIKRPRKIGLPRENVFIQIQDDLLIIKCMLRTSTLLLISYIRYTKHVRFYLPLPISVTISIFTVSALICLTLTPNIPNLLTAFPQHIIISPIHCTGYTALLKNLHHHFW